MEEYLQHEYSSEHINLSISNHEEKDDDTSPYELSVKHIRRRRDVSNYDFNQIELSQNDNKLDLQYIMS